MECSLERAELEISADSGAKRLHIFTGWFLDGYCSVPWVGKTPLEEGTATHPGIHAWRIPWTEVPGGLQSMGSQRVRHD